jgi:hypothetical protein
LPTIKRIVPQDPKLTLPFLETSHRLLLKNKPTSNTFKIYRLEPPLKISHLVRAHPLIPTLPNNKIKIFLSIKMIQPVKICNRNPLKNKTKNYENKILV